MLSNDGSLKDRLILLHQAFKHSSRAERKQLKKPPNHTERIQLSPPLASLFTSLNPIAILLIKQTKSGN